MSTILPSDTRVALRERPIRGIAAVYLTRPETDDPEGRLVISITYAHLREVVLPWSCLVDYLVTYLEVRDYQHGRKTPRRETRAKAKATLRRVLDRPGSALSLTPPARRWRYPEDEQ